MVTPVSTYRQHSANDQNPWLKGDCYEHMVRMSPADAADRGIKTGDRVLVYNQFGEVEITAYVSSKLLPGTVSIAHGEWSKFDHVRSCPTASTPQATATCSSATPICRTSSARC